MKKIEIKTKCKKLLSDIYTPVGIYLRLRDRFRDTILLESTDYHVAENSYSFICINAIAGIEISDTRTIEFKLPGQAPEKKPLGDLSDTPRILWEFMQRFDSQPADEKPIRAVQGLFGYSCFDAVQFFDTIRMRNRPAAESEKGIPLMRYRLYQYVIAINHFKDELYICENEIAGLESELLVVESLIKSKDLPIYPFRVIGEDTPIVVSGLQFLPVKRTDWLVTAFLQDEIELVRNRLSVTLGTKLLRTNFTGIKPEPSARIAWTPSDRHTLWAAYTHALRTPSDAEENFSLLGYVGPTPAGPAFARFNPNPAFAPEQLNGYELGYRQLFRKNLYLDLTTFVNRYHDLFSEDLVGGFGVESTPAPPHLLLPAQFANGLYGTTQGFEIAPEWQPWSFWRLRASYSFLNMHIQRAKGSLDVEPPQQIEGLSPKSQFMAQSAFDLSKTLQLDLSYRFI
ncbi:MAG: TonB-dependent receptor, partial [Bacteroidota bacterium]